MAFILTAGKFKDVVILRTSAEFSAKPDEYHLQDLRFHIQRHAVSTYNVNFEGRGASFPKPKRRKRI